MAHDCTAINAITAALACRRQRSGGRSGALLCHHELPARSLTMIGSKLITATLSAALLALTCAASAQPAPPDNKPDATLRSTPETVVWGYFAADIPPALRIKSGQTVRIDTVSHGGVNTGVD